MIWVEGAGNRFALVDAIDGDAPADPPSTAVELASDPRRPDGLLLLDRDAAGHVRMTVYNRDGSRPEACGNGLRCVAWAAVEAGHAPRGTEFQVATDAGIRRACVDDDVRVSMGAGRRVGTHQLDGLVGIECDLGNPHLVLHAGSWSDDQVETLGPRYERDPRFPRGTNVEFVVGAGTRFTARVWERGVGETAACGTGACAIAVALAEALPVEVDLPGGLLTVDRVGDELWLQGPVARL